MERGKLRRISVMILQNENTRNEIARAITQQGTIKQASSFFELYILTVLVLAVSIVLYPVFSYISQFTKHAMVILIDGRFLFWAF
jgi:hypothetical protein